VLLGGFDAGFGDEQGEATGGEPVGAGVECRGVAGLQGGSVRGVVAGQGTVHLVGNPGESLGERGLAQPHRLVILILDRPATSPHRVPSFPAPGNTGTTSRMGIDRLLKAGPVRLVLANTLSRAAFGATLAGLLLASTACSTPHSTLGIGTPLPAHQVLRMDGLNVTVDDVSQTRVNTDGSQQYVETDTVSDPAGHTEPLTFNEGDQVLLADGKQYPADTQATVGISNASLMQVFQNGETRQIKVVYDVPAGVKVTGAGVVVNHAMFRINLAS
jgi:hypothetical protein